MTSPTSAVTLDFINRCIGLDREQDAFTQEPTMSLSTSNRTDATSENTVLVAYRTPPNTPTRKGSNQVILRMHPSEMNTSPRRLSSRCDKWIGVVRGFESNIGNKKLVKLTLLTSQMGEMVQQLCRRTRSLGTPDFMSLSGGMNSPTMNRKLTGALFDFAIAQGNNNPKLLKLLTRELPKVALHEHLTGLIFPQQYLEFAREEGLYFNPETGEVSKTSDEGYIPFRELFANPSPKYKKIVQALIDGMNAAKGVNSANREESGEDFFKVFAKAFTFSERLTATGIMSLERQLTGPLDEAAQQNMVYMELFSGIYPECPSSVKEYFEKYDKKQTLEFTKSSLYAVLTNSMKSTGWLDECFRDLNETAAQPLQLLNIVNLWEFDTPYQLLVQSGKVEEYVQARLKMLDELMPQTGHPDYRLITEVARDERTLAEFFTDQVCAAELVRRSKHYVGMTIAGEETTPHALLNYDTHMRMLNYIHWTMDKPSKSLHAGEFTLDKTIETASPAELAQHIPKAIKVGQAQRLGHALAVTEESLKLVKEHGIGIEACPPSNKQILSIDVDALHPLNKYLAAGVDISINTDDGAILVKTISDVWFEVLKNCATSWKKDLKCQSAYEIVIRILRSSLEQSFLKGESIYKRHESGNYSLKPEFTDVGSNHFQMPAAYAKSEKARIQQKLEIAFVKFEAKMMEWFAKQEFEKYGFRPSFTKELVKA